TQRTTPPFRADVVGSLLRPPALLEARERWKKRELSDADLRRLEDDAIREAVKLQEDAGLSVATDGEFRRELWHMDFLAKFKNVTVVDAGIKMRFHSEAGDIDFAPPGTRIIGKLGRPPEGIFVKDFEFLKSVTHVTGKQTIPSPSNMHFRSGRKEIDSAAYPDLDAFYADLARVYGEEIAAFGRAGCRYLQLDDVNLAYLCDPKLAADVRTNIGEDPKKLPQTYAKLINESIASRPKDMTVCVHLCRGNAYSTWMAEGGYEPVAEVLFNEVDVDGFFLEYDTPRAGDFAPLRFVPKGKTIVLGLVTTKHGRLESKDDLKRRIAEAAKHVPLEQLALSPQCGFASGAAGNKLSIEDEKAKLRLIVEVAHEVWD
ncbi:MAG TPA: 5-methyltetrahydropteroyltriglutamate--homocysteine S-methyltransferase, partial [Candidatus Binatia bacterium]|nr:5-methyltetrahydropteroyltriglutamate--homocysteine S-methyltransferase [Candidatus Binatia bacterium]